MAEILRSKSILGDVRSGETEFSPSADFHPLPFKYSFFCCKTPPAQAPRRRTSGRKSVVPGRVSTSSWREFPPGIKNSTFFLLSIPLHSLLLFFREEKWGKRGKEDPLPWYWEETALRDLKVLSENREFPEHSIASSGFPLFLSNTPEGGKEGVFPIFSGKNA